MFAKLPYTESGRRVALFFSAGSRASLWVTDAEVVIQEGEEAMAMYMVQFVYADQTWAALTQTPHEHTIPSSDLIEKLGGKLIQVYYCFGEYDGLVIFEAPDDISASAVSLSSLAAGHLKVNKITKLFTAD